MPLGVHPAMEPTCGECLLITVDEVTQIGVGSCDETEAGRVRLRGDALLFGGRSPRFVPAQE